MIERKCLSCGTWNQANAYCNKCGKPVSPEAIENAKEQVKAFEEANKPKDRLEVLQEKAKNHPWGIIRFMYRVAYSIGFIVVALGSFFAYLVAWTAS